MDLPFDVPVEGRELKDWAASSVLSLGAVVALVAVSYLGLDTVVRNVADDRVEDRLANAVAAADVVNQAVAARGTTVRTAAAGLSPWSGSDQDRARTFTALERLVAQVPELSGGLVVIDPSGAAVASDRTRERLLGDRLDGPHVADALAGATAVSPVLEDPIGGAASLQVAAPLHDAAGEVTGALVAFDPLQHGFLATALGRVAPTPGTALVLIGPGGAVVPRAEAGAAAGTDQVERHGLDTWTPATQAAEGTGTVTYAGAGNVERFAVYAPVDGGWALVQHEPSPGIEALPTLVRRAGAAVGVALVLAVLLALVLAERRTRGAREDADRAKRAVLAVAGHELRTPLTVVRGMSVTAVARWDVLADAHKLQLVQTVERQARTLEHLIERLLFAAHLEAGVGGVVDRRPVDVAALVREAVTHHAAIAPLHTITFEAGDVGPGVGDRKALDQVVFHLLDNAVKYSPSGGTILVRVAATRRAVELTVEDEGVGLPADPSRLFEAFTQVEDVDTRTREEGGVGLGLYIVRSLVEQMGGAVRAEPSDSGGARFVVTLARARVDEPALAS